MTYLPDNTPAVSFSDGAHVDAFGRLRVSHPNLQFSAMFDTSDRTLYWDGADSIAEVSLSQSVVAVDANGYPNDSGSLVVSAGALMGGTANRGGATLAPVGDLIPLAASYAGVPDEAWLCARLPVNPNAGNIMATLTYKEVR